MKKLFALTLALLVLFITACGANSAPRDAMLDANAGNMYYGAKAESESMSVTSPSASTSKPTLGYPTDDAAPSESNPAGSAFPEGRKIIRTMNINAETKAFDEAAASIESLTASLGGYIEASSRSGGSLHSGSSVIARSASYTLRVPAEQLDAFRAGLGEGINVVRESSGIDDITDRYFDVDARLSTLRTEEERLLDMLEKATELEYLITLEQRLSEVRYQIESYTGTLRRYDSQVAYSTVRLTLDEVLEYTPVTQTPKTFGERMGIAFRDSWADFADGCKSFAIGFVYALPTLLVLAVIFGGIAAVLTAVIKRAKKKKKEHTAE